MGDVFTAVRAISDVTAVVSSTFATLNCTLPCISPNLQCSLFNITTNDGDVTMVTNATSDVIGSVMSYSYPTQQINISNLLVNATYKYCVTAVDITNKLEVGEPVCGSFQTPSMYGSYTAKLLRGKLLLFSWLFTLPQVLSHESMMMLVDNISIQACYCEGFPMNKNFPL